jgi:cytoskeletal protein RodZ
MSSALLNIGQKIQKERFEQKTTISKIQKKLNLAKNYLHQIEQGTLDENLNMIIVSRYLKLYLEYLDMDTDSLLQKYKAEYLKQNKKSNAHIIKKDSYIYPQKYTLKLTIILLILFVLTMKIIEPKNNKKLLEKLSLQKELLLK